MQDAQVHALAAGARQVVRPHQGACPQLVHVEVGGAQAQQLGAQLIAPGRLVLLHEPLLLEGAQDAVRGALGQSQRRGDVRQAEPPLAAREQAQHRGRPFERLDVPCHRRTASVPFDCRPRRRRRRSAMPNTTGPCRPPANGRRATVALRPVPIAPNLASGGRARTETGRLARVAAPEPRRSRPGAAPEFRRVPAGPRRPESHPSAAVRPAILVRLVDAATTGLRSRLPWRRAFSPERPPRTDRAGAKPTAVAS